MRRSGTARRPCIKCMRLDTNAGPAPGIMNTGVEEPTERDNNGRFERRSIQIAVSSQNIVLKHALCSSTCINVESSWCSMARIRLTVTQ